MRKNVEEVFLLHMLPCAFSTCFQTPSDSHIVTYKFWVHPLWGTVMIQYSELLEASLHVIFMDLPFLWHYSQLPLPLILTAVIYCHCLMSVALANCQLTPKVVCVCVPTHFRVCNNCWLAQSTSVKWRAVTGKNRFLIIIIIVIKSKFYVYTQTKTLMLNYHLSNIIPQ